MCENKNLRHFILSACAESHRERTELERADHDIKKGRERVANNICMAILKMLTKSCACFPITVGTGTHH